jgi:hypothetical protein
MGLLHEAFDGRFSGQTKQESWRADAARSTFERALEAALPFQDVNLHRRHTRGIVIADKIAAERLFPGFSIGITDHDIGIEIEGRNDLFALEIGGYKSYPIMLPISAFMPV